MDYTARLACKGSPAVQAKGNLAMFHWSVAGDLASIAVPILVLAGDKDIVTLPLASQHIGSVVPAAVTRAIPGCGHMGFMERHEAYNAEIGRFAEQLLNPPAVP